MAIDPRKVESFLEKLATDDGFRAQAEKNPAKAYKDHGLTYNVPTGGKALPSKAKIAAVVKEFKDRSSGSNHVYADKVGADLVFANTVYHLTVYKHSGNK